MTDQEDEAMDTSESLLQLPPQPQSSEEMKVDGAYVNATAPIEDIYQSLENMKCQATNATHEEQHQTTAPSPDEVKVFVWVEWPDIDLSQEKRSRKLEMALQTFLNKDFKVSSCKTNSLTKKTSECRNVTLVDKYCATVIIPSSDLEELLHVKETVLYLKEGEGEGQPCKVQFHKTRPPPEQTGTQRSDNNLRNTAQDIPMKVCINIDISGYNTTTRNAIGHHFSKYQTSHDTLTINGTFEEAEQFCREVNKVIRDSEPRFVDVPNVAAATSASHDLSNGMMTREQGGKENITIPLPLVTFWYMNLAYGKEIKRIGTENGVKITANVIVTIEEDQETSKKPCLTKASTEFTDLVQKHSSDFNSCTFDLEKTDTKDLFDRLKNIQKKDSRLVLSGSSEEFILYGSSRDTMAAQNTFGLVHHSSMNLPASSGVSGWKYEDRPQNITMNIKDQLVTNGLRMHLSHWQLMTNVFDQKLKDIKDKFGVTITSTNMPNGEVEVRAQPISDRQTVALESHALRALMRIYQRVATSTMTCSLLAPEQKTAVEDKLKEVSLLPYVWPDENHNQWGLVGLPQHLGPAVAELEAKLRRPVFKEKDKQRIRDYNSSIGSAVGGAAVAERPTGNDDDMCCICRELFTDKTTLTCKHEFCKECLEQSVASLGPACPLCKDVFGIMEGDQPEGKMTVNKNRDRLPGFTDCGTIIIRYEIAHGNQSGKHPNPGKHFYGTTREAYLPDNKEGREVLGLLRRAFDQKLIFTVGTSRTTGAMDTVTWNDIHHKTNIYGGPESFGYPDPGYLARVKEELKSKGIE